MRGTRIWKFAGPTAARAASVAIAAVGLAAGLVGVGACRQVLGVQDLGVAEGGHEAGSGAEAGAPEASPSAACADAGSTEGCFSCCANVPGGDQTFFKYDFHTCVCGTECSALCSANFCTASPSSDTNDCDICAFETAFDPAGQCQQTAQTAGQANAGTQLIYDCISNCPVPSDTECAGLNTLRGCYDCCEGKHLGARSAFFGGAGNSCACNGGGCASACPTYCGSGGVDVAACTRCALDSLVDGGCATTGASLCGSSECQQMVACMQGCMQPQ
jgi:hypothetical protein